MEQLNLKEKTNPVIDATEPADEVIPLPKLHERVLEAALTYTETLQECSLDIDLKIPLINFLSELLKYGYNKEVAVHHAYLSNEKGRVNKIPLEYLNLAEDLAGIAAAQTYVKDTMISLMEKDHALLYGEVKEMGETTICVLNLNLNLRRALKRGPQAFDALSLDFDLQPQKDYFMKFSDFQTVVASYKGGLRELKKLVEVQRAARQD